jgi:hypothetical protein
MRVLLQEHLDLSAELKYWRGALREADPTVTAPR